MTRKKEKKAFSMRRKFLFIFGTFTFITSVTLAVFAIRVARQAVTEKVESHLIDKATDTAEIIDGRIEALFQFIENIADISMIISENVSISEKLAYLKKITTNRTEFTSINIADCDGNLYLPGKTINVSKQNWYPIVMSGERFISEPFISAANGQLIIVLAIPTYDENRKINGALNVSVGGSWLSKQIDDIVIGKTGACSILGLQGTTIAHRNIEFVEKQENIFETVKSNPAFKSLAVFCNNAITSKESAVGFYELFGEKNISSFAKMKSTGWTIIISAPTDEFMGTIVSLRNRMLIVGLSILTVNLIILFFIVRTMVKPINVVVKALKDIAQGEGDLTVRLPLVGSQEIINLSQFFNKTIEK